MNLNTISFLAYQGKANKGPKCDHFAGQAQTLARKHHILMDLLLHPNIGIQNAITLGVFLKVILSSPCL
jgi:hypothetical protein